MSKLIDIVKGAYTDASVGIIDEVTKVVPEIGFFDARLIKGTQFKTLVKDGLPTTSFRTLNNGIDSSRSSNALRTFDLGILAGLCQVDKAEALGCSVMSKEEFLADQATDFIASGMKTLADKIWYGSSANAEGFNGVAALVTTKVNAGGDTANACSSVFAVGNDATKACGLVFSENSGFFLRDDLTWTEGVMSGTNSKPVPCYQTDLTGWAGFSAVNYKKMARLANLDHDHGLTDALLAKLVNAYRKETNGQNPDALFASFAQLQALQVSRATSYPAVRGTKGDLYAPFPTDFEGIPLIASGSVVDTEAVVAFA